MRREGLGSDEDGQLQRQRRCELRGAHGVPRGICKDGFIGNPRQREKDKDKDKDRPATATARGRRGHMRYPLLVCLVALQYGKSAIIATLVWTTSRELCSSVGLSNLDSAYSQT